jgi:hypothetical protein
MQILHTSELCSKRFGYFAPTNGGGWWNVQISAEGWEADNNKNFKKTGFLKYLIKIFK